MKLGYLVGAALAAYSDSDMQISLHLSQIAYCGKDKFLNLDYTGVLQGFVATKVIYGGLIDDTEGFIGYMPQTKSIYVVFRGSSSIPDFITDIGIIRTNWDSFPECKCGVHSGFYNSERHVLSDILIEVARLRNLYPSYSVHTTGHSLGAALALLTQMDLIKAGYAATMINFGQPRVGDKDFAKFVQSKTSYAYRVTHWKDIVVHNPTSDFPISFEHHATEVFEDKNHVVRTCSTTNGEDKTCTDQFGALSGLGVDDHLSYLNLYMGILSGNCNTVKSEFLQ